MPEGPRTEKFSVAEFGIIFNVRGNAQTALKDMARLIERIDGKVAKTGRTGRRMGGMFGGMLPGMAGPGMRGGRGGMVGGGRGGGGRGMMMAGAGIAGQMAEGATAANRFGGSLESVQFQSELAADSLRRLRDAVAGPMIAMGTAGLRMAADVEQARNKLEFLAKKMKLVAGDIYGEVQLAGLKTLQTTRQVTDLTSGLLIQGVNPFVQEMKDLNVILAHGAELSTSAVEVLSDMSTIAPFGMRSISMGIRDALGRGKITLTRGLGASMDLSRDKLDRYNKALSKGKGQQEKFNLLMVEMAKDFGGMAAAQKDAFNFNLMQIDDFLEKMATDLFGKALPLLTKAIQDALGYMQELLDSDRLIPLQKAITEIVTVLVDAARWAAKIAVAIFEFILANPWVVKMAAALAGVLTVATTLLATLVGIVGMLAALKFAFVAISGLVGPLLIPLAKILFVVAGIAVVAALITRHMTGAKSWVETWERFKLVAKGVWELMSSLNGEVGYLSRETGEALQRAGLLDLVIDITSLLKNAKAFVKGYWEGAMKNFKPAMRAGLKLWETLSKVATRFVGLVDKIFGTSLAATKGAETTSDRWQRAGDVLGQTASAVFVVMEKFFKAADKTMKLVDKILSALEKIMNSYRKFKTETLGIEAPKPGEAPAWTDMLLRAGPLGLVTGLVAKQKFRAGELAGEATPGMTPEQKADYERSKRASLEEASFFDAIKDMVGAGSASELVQRRQKAGVPAERQRTEEQNIYNRMVSAVKEGLSKATINMDGRAVNEQVGNAAQQGQEAGA